MQSVDTNTLYAIKILDRERIFDINNDIRPEDEVEIHRALDHPNIVPLLGDFEERGKIHIAFEYLSGGDLFTYLSKRGYLSERRVAHITRSIANALYYCHTQHHIVHCDVKPENIVISGDLEQVKLIDFGFATHERVEDNEGKLKKKRGTLIYMSPEMVGETGYDHRTDIWSLGVLMYELLTCILPFCDDDDDDNNTLCRNIRCAHFTFPDTIVLSNQVKRLIKRILVPDVTQRVSIPNILHDTWFRQCAVKMSPLKYNFDNNNDDDDGDDAAAESESNDNKNKGE
jgi:serine/threonine protein kinase